MRYSEPGTRLTPSKSVGRMSSSGAGGMPSSNSAAMVELRASDRMASGPQKPWVRLACGSASIRSTRRPARENVPARWWQVDVLPTPPFWFSRATEKACMFGGRPRGLKRAAGDAGPNTRATASPGSTRPVLISNGPRPALSHFPTHRFPGKHPRSHLLERAGEPHRLASDPTAGASSEPSRVKLTEKPGFFFPRCRQDLCRKKAEFREGGHEKSRKVEALC